MFQASAGASRNRVEGCHIERESFCETLKKSDR